MDAIAEYHPDEIIISTYPAHRRAGCAATSSSASARRPRSRRARGRRLDRRACPSRHLAVANRTAPRPPARGAQGAHVRLERHVFIFVVPQEGGQGVAARQARAA
jgi:hypothetical protein